MSLEIFNGSFAASLWADAHGDSLVETAVTSGALDWDLKRTAWGVVFEVAFKTEAEWEQYRNTEAVRNALHTAPDAQSGVLIYRGRSLDGGRGAFPKPKPRAGSGAAALALPFELPFVESLPAFFSDSGADRRKLTSTRSLANTRLH